MRFLVRADRDMTVVFEPTAEEVSLKPGETLTVEWFAEKTDGMVSGGGGPRRIGPELRVHPRLGVRRGGDLRRPRLGWRRMVIDASAVRS
ncbi:hypothetical protein H0E86_05725 [Streptomyces sp. SCSIO-PteL053]|nr:hypothetical protein H0E86_05725 [Streptomyces sp. SCSIO-PteL053]